MEVTLVVDRSGSMVDIAEEMTNEISNYVDSLDDGVTVNVFSFDGSVEHSVVDYVTDGIDSFGYRIEPRGATALFDAMGTALKKGLEESAADKHLFIVVSDGYENSSQTFKAEDIKNLIKDAEGRGWELIYFGANQDAVLEGKTFGGYGVTYAATTAGTRAVGSSMTVSTASYFSGGSSKVDSLITGK